MSSLLSIIAEELAKEDMQSVCMFCKKIMKEGPEGAPISHGICDKCLEEK